MLGKTGKAKRGSGTAWNTKGKGKFTEFLDCLFLSDHCCNYATPRHACAGDCLSASQQRGGGRGHPSWGLPTSAGTPRRGERKESHAPFHSLWSQMTFLLSHSQIPTIPAQTAPAPAPDWASGPQNLPTSAFSPLSYSFWLITRAFTRPSLHRTAAHPACAKSLFSPGLAGKPQASQHLAPGASSDSF